MTQRCGPTQSYRDLEREVAILRRLAKAVVALRPHIETKLGGIVGSRIAALDAALRELAVEDLHCVHGRPFNDPCDECAAKARVETADEQQCRLCQDGVAYCTTRWECALCKGTYPYLRSTHAKENEK